MDGTAHLVTGAALGRRLHPVLALAAGLASHIVLDAIPHWNYTGWRPYSDAMLADAIVGSVLVIAIALAAPRPWGALVGAAGGIFPEVERMLTQQRYDIFHRMGIDLSWRETEIGPPWGLVTQAAVVLIALMIGLRLSRDRRHANPGRGGARAGR